MNNVTEYSFHYQKCPIKEHYYDTGDREREFYMTSMGSLRVIHKDEDVQKLRMTTNARVIRWIKDKFTKDPIDDELAFQYFCQFFENDFKRPLKMTRSRLDKISYVISMTKNYFNVAL